MCVSTVVQIITATPPDGSLYKRKIRCYSLACTLHKQAKHQLTVENHMPCSFQTTNCMHLASFLTPIYPPWRYFFILFNAFPLSKVLYLLPTPILKFSQSSLSSCPLPDPNDRSPIKVCTLLPIASLISSCTCTAILSYGEMHRKEEN